MRHLVRVLALLLAVSTGRTAVSAKSLASKKSVVKKKTQSLNRPVYPPGWSWPPSKASKQIGQKCLERLTELGVVWKKVGAPRKIVTAIVVPDMQFGSLRLVSYFKTPPFVMDCHFAEALARHAAPALASVGVHEIVFSSIHVYRNVDGTRRLSRHALGLAVDVYRLVTDDGIKHVVEGGYNDNDILLWDAERALNATGAFRMVLTPGNDPGPHHDHFHIEARVPDDHIATPPGPLYPRRPPPLPAL